MDRDVPSDSAPSRLVQALHEIAMAASRPSSPSELFAAIARSPALALNFDFGVLLLADEARHELEVAETFGLPPAYRARFAERTPIRIGPGAYGNGASNRAYQTLEQVAIEDCRNDREVEQWLPVTKEFGVIGMLTTPIVFDGEAIGTLNCFTRTAHVFSTYELETVRMLAQHAALALEAARIRRDDVAQLRKLQRAHEELALRTESLRKSESIHERLRQLVLSGGRLATLAETLADSLGAQILIVGTEFEILAHSYVSDTVALSEASALGDNERLAFLVEAAIAKKSSTSTRDADFSTYGSVSIVPVFLMGEYVASILALGVDLTTRGFERPALENASTLVALELLKDRLRFDSEAQARGNIIRYLLDGEFADDADLVQAGQPLFDFRRPHRALVVRTRIAESRESTPIRGEHRRRIEKRLAKGFLGKNLPVLSEVIGDTIVLLASDEVPLHDLEAEVRNAHLTARESSRLEWRIGIGRSARGISGLRQAHVEARRCALLAERLMSETSINIEQFGIFGLLLVTSELEDLFRFSRERLSPLRDHPAHLQFLREFFAADGRIKDIAETDHVHVNTVKYRLRRVGEALGADLRSADVLMELRLAVMIDDLRFARDA